jgi:two-component system LytT family sensor kinase
LAQPAQATFRVLHAALQAALPLRDGLTAESTRAAVNLLAPLVGAPAVCLYGEDGVWAWAGQADDHVAIAAPLATEILRSGRPQTFGPELMACQARGCPVRYAMMVPVLVDGRPAGVLAAFAPEVSAGLAAVVVEVTRWVANQLELAEVGRLRKRLTDAEVRALRAQISPHFIYNALTTIASFSRTDPGRARELLLDFADFTRYSFQPHGDFTTLARELQSIEQYLTLERARFGERLTVVMAVPPEVLAVEVPFLGLQPLAENAVRHGLARKSGGGTVTIRAQDAAAEVHVIIEDDGLGMDPGYAARVLAGRAGGSAGIGMSNVDARLRQLYGETYGLTVQTAVGIGTRITVRIPKGQAGPVRPEC